MLVIHFAGAGAQGGGALPAAPPRLIDRCQGSWALVARAFMCHGTVRGLPKGREARVAGRA